MSAASRRVHSRTRFTPLLQIPLEHIRVTPGWNIRSDLTRIDELATSIASEGIKVPLRVIADTNDADLYHLREGHRRFAAVEYAVRNLNAPIKMVPAFVLPASTPDEQLIIDGCLANDGEPLDMLDRGKAYLRLVNYGYSVRSIAEKVGQTSANVSKALVLARAPVILHHFVRANRLSATQAYELASKFQDAALLAHLRALGPDLIQSIEQGGHTPTPHANNGHSTQPPPTDPPPATKTPRKKLSRSEVASIVGGDPRASKHAFLHPKPGPSVANTPHTESSRTPHLSPSTPPASGPTQPPAPLCRLKHPDLLASLDPDDVCTGINVLKFFIADLPASISTPESCERYNTLLIVLLCLAHKLDEEALLAWVRDGIMSPAISQHLHLHPRATPSH